MRRSTGSDGSLAPCAVSFPRPRGASRRFARQSAVPRREGQPPPQSGPSDDGTRLRSSSGPGFHLDRGDHSDGHSVAGCSRQAARESDGPKQTNAGGHGRPDRVLRDHGQSRRFRTVPPRLRSAVEFAFERNVLHACSILGMLARGRRFLTSRHGAARARPLQWRGVETSGCCSRQ